jgi:hypothetical protein
VLGPIDDHPTSAIAEAVPSERLDGVAYGGHSELRAPVILRSFRGVGGQSRPGSPRGAGRVRDRSR